MLLFTHLTFSQTKNTQYGTLSFYMLNIIHHQRRFQIIFAKMRRSEPRNPHLQNCLFSSGKQQHKYLLKCRMPEYFDSRSLKEPVTVKVIMLLVAKARSRLKEVASWSVFGSPDRNDTMGSRPLDVNYRLYT